jgi:hypothetical protein
MIDPASMMIITALATTVVGLATTVFKLQQTTINEQRETIRDMSKKFEARELDYRMNLESTTKTLQAVVDVGMQRLAAQSEGKS